MPPTNIYSIGGEDEADSSYDHNGRQLPYHDSVAQQIISPPSHYVSPPSPEPLSPVSLSRAEPYPIQNSREYSQHPYSDRSASPPPVPPPHTASLNRHSYAASAGWRPPNVISVPGEQLASEESYPPSSFDRRMPQAGLLHTSLPPPMPEFNAARPRSQLHEYGSYGPQYPLAQGAATPGSITPTDNIDGHSSRYSNRSIPLHDYYASQPHRMSHYSYHSSPYHSSSHNLDATVSDASINPQYIIDDGEDDFAPSSRKQPHNSYQQSGVNKSGVTAAIGAAAGTGVLGGILGRRSVAPMLSGTYEPVDHTVEKSAWLTKETKKRKRNSWLCGIGIGLVIIAALAAGIVGGVLGSRSSKSGSGNTNNANDDTNENGDLDINSAEIKKLMNNPNLHKVFPGMDYTPWGVQYPLCETYPPSQNNVTRDMAVLSQLTNTVRLYGTDCNQTEMVLHAIDKLQLKNVKVWLGVWIDTNTTTTERQIAKMYTILDQVKDRSIFKGAIVGNEALYRAGEDKAQSKAELIQILTDVKSNFTSLGYDLPVATSDLGDNWDSSLVAVVDYVMSNIHPFFAGVSAESAAAWTWDFWDTHDLALTTNTPNVKQIISETGWPSDGGTDCGGTTGDCATGQSGATASVDNMNTFMADWVCQALANGTDYFWFEAFDEPWKVQFNTPGKEWEDKWGLMDPGRNLKPGIKIPSCGGKTVS